MVRTLLQLWLNAVASVIVGLLDRAIAPKIIRLVERDDAGFDVRRPGEADSVVASLDRMTMVAGRRVEIILGSRRFLFRRLELPLRATDFLDGIVRAQIDRLTPWSPNDAVFGCGRPVPGANGITVTIAATMRSRVDGILSTVGTLHPASIVVFAQTADGAEPIRVCDHHARGRLDQARLARMLGIVLALSIAAACGGVLAAAFVADQLAAQQDELARLIAQRRVALRASSEGDAASPLSGLEKRKHEERASVVVLEALSRALPDHTYLTQLHIDGARLQIAGITRDAPSLIPLLERSGPFTRATFYAPTTRATADAGERFHVEAQIVPAQERAP